MASFERSPDHGGVRRRASDVRSVPAYPSPPSRCTARRRGLGHGGVVVGARAVVAFIAAAAIPSPRNPHPHGAAQGACSRSRTVARQAGAGAGEQGVRLQVSRPSVRDAGLRAGERRQRRGPARLRPLRRSAARRFDRPVAEYKRYAERWAVRLGRSLRRSPPRCAPAHAPRAERGLVVAFDDYLHLGAVYGFIPGSLTTPSPSAAARPGPDALPRTAPDREGPVDGPSPCAPWSPVSVAVARAVVTAAPHAPSDAGQRLSTTSPRAHEILEDAQRDLMSGAEVPWSREGVIGTAAGLVATDRR